MGVSRSTIFSSPIVIQSSDTYSSPMNPIFGETIKESLGQGKKKKTQQPQVETEDEVEAENDPSSSSGTIPPLIMVGQMFIQMLEKMEQFQKTQDDMKESIK
ncbi:unnamed protein product, partial [Ilex paraguariensis]